METSDPVAAKETLPTATHRCKPNQVASDQSTLLDERGTRRGPTPDLELAAAARDLL